MWFTEVREREEFTRASLNVAPSPSHPLPLAQPMSTLSEWVSELHPNGSTAAKTLFVAASVIALYKLTGHVLREYIIIPRTTILRDIDLLHIPRRDGKIPGRAVICGGR